MKNFSNRDIAEYLYRNFTSVDGLWFVKIEELFGFERALEIDKEVWKVLPKIQARFIKAKLEEKFLAVQNAYLYQNQTKKQKENHYPGQGLVDFGPEEFFVEALRIKMKLDKFKFRLIKKPGIVKVTINQCPWHEIMIKSKRKHLSGMIGSSICSTEYTVFASEFLKNSSFTIARQICNSGTTCTFEFKVD